MVHFVPIIICPQCATLRNATKEEANLYRTGLCKALDIIKGGVEIKKRIMEEIERTYKSTPAPPPSTKS
jgi:hypothetical protein